MALGRRELLADYERNYPEELIDGEVQLFAQKSGNGAIAALVPTLPRPHTREHLMQVLSLATNAQIIHVGW